MCDPTGVWSGTLWSEEDLFDTKENAELECAKRNAEELANEFTK